ncbi:hypothetical protein HPB52_003182 [Rhipicephalus sanguineus]|uniref:Uncharacterized protein n=1 Tax=Rhipicephalus sanguineus TaxID=34632 RepID=A0A9D4T6P5_RHISA|nr:hypothetical protein HPB52_003182 [Rhipicephalus sanguineus]
MEDVSTTCAFGLQEAIPLLNVSPVVQQVEQQKEQHRSQGTLSLSKATETEKESMRVKQSLKINMPAGGNNDSSDDDSSEDSSLENFIPIDVDFMADLDDETWLYVPPEVTGANAAQEGSGLNR